ncbi:LysE family translocator [Pendulispora rubella]|uniref:LysE family translocator n=1 Tax=Pendulispora rubella TaxID=2741070 RepID=A0ABZ2L6I3_9BACT
MLIPYLLLCLLITITPGLDTAMVIRSALAGGKRAGVRTAIGCAAGLFVHAVAVAMGLAEILLRSAAAFHALKLAGAILLIVLGARSLWAAYRASEAPAQEEKEEAPVRGSTPFVQGLLCNLTNPKATLFFMATLPQFIGTGEPSRALPVALGLAMLAVLFSLAGLTLIALAVHRLRDLLRSRRARRVQDGLLGTVLIALGVRVATE